ncbi:alpha-1,3/1,6-mannosyltransferase ALG2-like [Limulus polyphemus]|uniref:Alpha-1,3/1,6-mannosyltransferase ALG2 n=1 Tax=Limulus polyphemus TaxID=6850 RepID=A0ABM1B2M6_LIMPO|nr:alpha-1,3/1,6-mannosyltransferase ALG2-like [Limulus polyphemus]XP_022240550.1 alpha-1,3/1,6-mannosyltransferase ALG2-like [Limulus polyphemus]XP_022240551.1 alpha-1,3/1,6-mannosyltransferase ALG2-like [Limulus polyphemus]
MKIVFLHPDLGIGGAERLVVDAALALKSQDHEVSFVTAHHHPSHCFQETKDGTFTVTVVGDWMPRSLFGACYALCAYVRMIVAAFYLVFCSGLNPDVIFCDQISVCIPVLKLSKAKIVFYCHFPDQLLSQRQGWLKKLYRAPLDWLEEWTTGMAQTVLVNSKFTAEVFRQTFQSLQNVQLQVLYPSLNFSAFDCPLEGDLTDLNLKGVNWVFLSINRYERKKNLGLAIQALGKLRSILTPDVGKQVHLIMAGGYDDRVKENLEVFMELQQLGEDLGLTESLSFLKSPSDKLKHLLLHSCTAVLYTPENEHFGIVPLEAMYMSRPVIAANSGGPLETVIDGETGFLCPPHPENFATAMEKYVKDRSLAREMGENGKNHVRQHFSFQHFVEQLSRAVSK